MCDNTLMIRQDRLEEQLMAAIEQRVLNRTTLDYVVRRCEEEAKARLSEMERTGTIRTADSLKKQREELKARQVRLLDAIVVGGSDVRSVLARLHQVEAEISRLDGSIAAYRPVRPEVALNGIRERVTASLMQLREMLAGGDAPAPRRRLPNTLASWC